MTGLIGWLLLGMVLLPTLGAIAARLIARRADGALPRVVGGAGFGAAVLCAILLSRTPVDSESLGRLAIFLPSNDIRIARESFLGPLDEPNLTEAAPTPTQEFVINAPAPTPTSQASPTARARPTRVPTSTSAPTSTPDPTSVATTTPDPTSVPTRQPTAQPTTPPPPAAPAGQPQRYEVEPGDTLRGIAERFNISVTRLLDYNGLTPEEGDSLRIGQILYIPPQ
jgi:LysM repeat protein